MTNILMLSLLNVFTKVFAENPFFFFPDAKLICSAAFKTYRFSFNNFF